MLATELQIKNSMDVILSLAAKKDMSNRETLHVEAVKQWSSGWGDLSFISRSSIKASLVLWPFKIVIHNNFFRHNKLAILWIHGSARCESLKIFFLTETKNENACVIVEYAISVAKYLFETQICSQSPWWDATWPRSDHVKTNNKYQTAQRPLYRLSS